MIAALFLMPMFRVVSVGVALAVVISVGAARAAPTLAIGFGIVLVAGMVSPVDPNALIVYVAAVVIGTLAVGEMLRRSESLTLTIQLSLLIALVAGIGFQLSIGDQTAFWLPRLLEMVELLREMGSLDNDIDETLLVQRLQTGVPLASGFFIASQWYFAVVALAIGYYVFDQGRDKARARFGRFRDLNLGRVLAMLLVLLAVAAALTGSLLLTNLAAVALLGFGLQGLALLHWARHHFGWSPLVLVIGYMAVIPVQPYGVLLICVVGYVDAWFDLVRARKGGATN